MSCANNTAHIKELGHTRWSRNRHCCFNNQPSSPLSTNMRIPNNAEFIAFFVSTGQLTGFSNQRKIDIYDQYTAADTHRFPFHVAGADSELEALNQPLALCDRPLYSVQPGDTCNSIAERFKAPTLVSFIGHICTFYLSIKIQVPDHMRKRRDQWQLHQSQK